MQEPPETMKSRAVRSRDVREIVAKAFADLAQSAMIDTRAMFPEGAMNPPAMDETLDILQAAQHEANVDSAKREMIGTASYHPGFSEAD